MLRKKTMAAAVTSALLASVVMVPQAGAATNEELKKQIEALQQAVETLKQQVAQQPAARALPANIATTDDVEGVRADLENFKYDQDRLYERNTVKSVRDTSFYGTVQLRAQGQDQPTQAGNPALSAGDRYSTFDVPMAIFGVKGRLYRDYVEGKNLDYQLSFAYARRAAASGSNADLNLLDGFVRYNFLSTNGGPEIPRLNLTFGQQLLPFGQEAQSAEDLRPTINVATAPARLGLFNRQVGAIVRGDYAPFVDYAANYRAPLIEYAFGVVNGNYSNKLDDNNGKDLVGRVAFTLPVDYASWLREFKVGASIYKGTANVYAGNVAGGTSLKANGKRDRYGFDIYYNHAPYGVTYEYFQGRDELATATSQIVEARSTGHTLTLFYTLGDQFYDSMKTSAKFDDRWPQSIQPFYRYDYSNPNDRKLAFAGSAGDAYATVRTQTLGLNWFFAQTTKLQLGLNHVDYDVETTARKSYNELQAQLQYTF